MFTSVTVSSWSNFPWKIESKYYPYTHTCCLSVLQKRRYLKCKHLLYSIVLRYFPHNGSHNEWATICEAGKIHGFQFIFRTVAKKINWETGGGNFRQVRRQKFFFRVIFRDCVAFVAVEYFCLRSPFQHFFFLVLNSFIKMQQQQSLTSFVSLLSSLRDIFRHLNVKFKRKISSQ